MIKKIFVMIKKKKVTRHLEDLVVAVDHKRSCGT